MKQHKNKQFQTKIGTIAQKIANLTYIHDTAHNLNLVADMAQIKFPVCFEQPATKGTLLIRNENIRDKPDSKIYFLDIEPQDPNGEEISEIIDNMKHLVAHFLLMVKKSGMFEHLPDEITYTIVQNWQDIGLTGVRIDTPLRENKK